MVTAVTDVVDKKLWYIEFFDDEAVVADNHVRSLRTRGIATLDKYRR